MKQSAESRLAVLETKVKALGNSALESFENMDSLRNATTTHSVHLLVQAKVLAEILRQHPTDLSFVREELKEQANPSLVALALASLDMLIADANR